jgi:hypothetical protein
VGEAELDRVRLVRGELVGVDPAVDRQVLRGRLQVLADGEDLDAGAADVAIVARTSSGVSPRPTMMPVLTRPAYSPASRRRAASASSASVRS